MEKIHKSQEPWKKREPGGRLSKRAMKNKQLGERQRKRMEKQATLRVKVSCHKGLFLVPGLYKNFNVEVSIPMREAEFMERIAAAFPELQKGKF